ncbi:protein SchB [Achaetomium macrosporum]|uniref:Protein SchB n=1 Tax=Achaetomium macrosporum TaxID=79813 RepID=A0AAN7HC87_9PEZI|nr:protein SchB [Achaetomium macrosporum]
MPSKDAATPGGDLLPHIVGDDGTVSLFALGGAMVTRVLREPPEADARADSSSTRQFHFEVVIHPDHPRLRGLPKPSAHFHPYQEEYFTVIEGALGIEIEGVERVVRPGDGEFVVRRGVNHRLCFPSPSASADSAEEEQQQEPIRFYISAERTTNTSALDLIFFENWYAYQEQVVVYGKRLDMIQVLCTWDAGDSYVTLPWWVPFRSFVSRAMGVVVGRWLGGLLGYQPFYKCWTSDWELACSKMERSVFQRRFTDRAKTA